MSKKKLISFAENDVKVQTLEEINDSQFVKARMRCFSDGMTSHRYSFSLDVLRGAESTILGKPLLWAYSIWTDDANEHDASEIICGFIPKDAKDADITYEYDEDLHKTFMYVNCYIWAVYAKKLMQIFERTDGIKDVSTELWLIDSTEHVEEKYSEVNQFAYTGVTILGESVNPACQGANIEILKFSENEFLKAKEKFEKQLNNSSNSESSNDGSFFMSKNSNENKEENTLEKENSKNSATTNEPEVLENAKAVVATRISVTQNTDVYEDNGDFRGYEHEYHSKESTVVKEIPDVDTTTNAENKTADNACTGTNNTEDGATEPISDKNSAEVTVDKNSDEPSLEEKYSILEAKFSAKEAEMATLQQNYEALELKCSSLQQYHDNKENETKVMVIECALNDVADILSADEISQWREKSLTCANVDSFKNELKAYAFDLQKNSGIKPEQTLRNSIPNVEIEESGSVWDRLAKIF